MRKYNITNTTGFSHETRSKIKACLWGKDMPQKDNTLYNTAVMLENRFKKMFISNKQDRLAPLVKKETPSRSMSRSMSRSKSRMVSHQPSNATPPHSPRSQSSTPKLASELSLEDEFHILYLKLRKLTLETTYNELSNEAQRKYFG
jgi:hypothetical protein